MVDDEIEIRKAFTTLLNLEGHEVSSACSDNVALATFKEQDFDLVFSDIRMEDGDGLYFLSELKKLGIALPHLVFFKRA